MRSDLVVSADLVPTDFPEERAEARRTFEEVAGELPEMGKQVLRAVEKQLASMAAGECGFSAFSLYIWLDREYRPALFPFGCRFLIEGQEGFAAAYASEVTWQNPHDADETYSRVAPRSDVPF